MTTILKDFNYSLFSKCKEEYPYKEDNHDSAMKCKKNIKDWLEVVLTELCNIGLSHIYDIQDKREVGIEDILSNEDFLFYSYEQGTEEMFYVITQKDKTYLSRDDWFQKNSDDLLLMNDHDGTGLGFEGSKGVFDKIEHLGIPLWSNSNDYVYQRG